MSSGSAARNCSSEISSMRRSLRFFSSRIFGKHRWVNSGARRRKDGVSRFWISRQTKTVKTNTTPEKKAQPGESTSGDWAYTDTMLGGQNGNPCAGINRHEAENARVLRERGSDPLGLEFCGQVPRGIWRSV